ncbi:MAG: mechanosensitive ion channel family protein [bacterium]
MNNLVTQIHDWLRGLGLGPETTLVLTWVSIGGGIVVLSFLANYLAQKVILVALGRIAKKSKTTWDDVLVEHQVFTRLSHLAPALVVYFAARFLPEIRSGLERVCTVYMILVGLSVSYAFLNAMVDIYRTLAISKRRPIKGFVQVAKVILTIVLGAASIAVLMDKSPWLLLSGFGAMTAILLLVFKDSILGLVASVSLSANDMVAPGDWISMPKFGADGDVIDMTLTTVKVQNWDKTVTTIPAYALVADSFKNWRGMSESGGRRIKRALYIDMSSIGFCSDELLGRLERVELLKDYLAKKKEEVSAHNSERKVDTSEPINGRRLTNIGTFRAYVVEYLRAHPEVHQEMTFLVRHLEPGALGLPLEIYVFSRDQAWANYEAITADIFDHLLAVVPQFGLRLYQQPTGADIRALSAAGSAMPAGVASPV